MMDSVDREVSCTKLYPSISEAPRHQETPKDDKGLLPISQAGVFQPSATKIPLKPATFALLIQCTALIFAMCITWTIQNIALIQINILVFVILQGSIAMSLSMVSGMAIWWRIIQFVFPMAVWVMHGLQLPSGVYLCGFLLSLSLFWTTFRTQVPFYPSRPDVWRQVAEFIPEHRKVRMIDIGSGIGDLVMNIADSRSESLFFGIEIAPLPWLISVVRSWLKNSVAVFKLGDYRAINFADYDVIFAYLSPVAMPALWQKVVQEMPAGGLLLSYEFDIPGTTPSAILQLDENAPAIYVWRF